MVRLLYFIFSAMATGSLIGGGLAIALFGNILWIGIAQIVIGIGLGISSWVHLLQDRLISTSESSESL